jgi:DNA-binding CsgD family transcriptional regulator
VTDPTATTPTATTPTATTTVHPRPLGTVLEELLDHATATPPCPGTRRELVEMEAVLEAEHHGARYLLLRGEPAAERDEILLSAREHEIARMIARGHTNRTIAAVLEISPWTVSTHVRRVFAKLDVGSRAAMVARLSANGLVDDDGSPDARHGPRR